MTLRYHREYTLQQSSLSCKFLTKMMKVIKKICSRIYYKNDKKCPLSNDQASPDKLQKGIFLPT